MPIFQKALPETKLSLKTVFMIVYPALLFCLLMDFIGGYFLGANFEKFVKHYPLILLVLPAIMGLRGNVFGSMGSRVSTALHLGYTRSKISDPYIIFNVFVSITVANLPILMITVIGVFRFVFTGNYLPSVIVVFTSGVFMSLLLSISTVAIAVYAFRHGVDPDNIIGPLITSVADIVTIPGIVLFVHLYEIHHGIVYSLFTISAALFGYSLLIIFRYGKIHAFRREFLKVSEILGIVCFLALIELVSGHFLESFSREILRMGILSVLYPVVLDTLGNYGSVIGARSATRYHLGALKRPISKDSLYDMSYLALTSFINVAVMVPIAYFLARLSYNRIVLVISFRFLVMFSVTYFLISLIVMTLAVALSYYSGKIGFDPDNTTIPIITTIADLFGSIYVAALSRIAI